MKIQPRNEYVVVTRRKIQRNAGIIVPGQETEQNVVLVTAIGPGPLTSSGVRAPIEGIKVGDAVFIRGGEYEQFEHDGDEYLIVPQSAIIGVEVQDLTLAS